MAKWERLADFLGRCGDAVTLSWPEFDAVVGGIPASAARHRAWWSGDRPHTRAWRSAGFTVSEVRMGHHVTFTRVASPQAVTAAPSVAVSESTALQLAQPAATALPSNPPGQGPDLVLVACVKSKRATPAPARDLYTSALFLKERAYAEALGVPWFILSAEHGLVTPDEVLEPYERYLPTTPANYRLEWGMRVANRLSALVGSIKGSVVEVHAGRVYLDAVRSRLEALGAVVTDPLHGLRFGHRLAWYVNASLRPTVTVRSPDPSPELPRSVSTVDTAALTNALRDYASAVKLADFVRTGGAGLKVPGLYSWWVDNDGALELTRGIGMTIESGLIYAGLAGATRWPSGKGSSNTLWSRIAGMHLGKNREFSTFRRTLSAILFNAPTSGVVDEPSLTAWMHTHLRVRTHAYLDADTLGLVEEAVLEALDPPLNLRGMASSQLRRRLKELRQAV